ncbi:hypothetical protein [Marinigracilibium pacificum]|uniref:Uncharacterized protein n=1 Tax=Marinigracilibium pacificum TaxID=2729599 RepID=A0A848J3T7_9BACT|nr:hypothetical protein [Marinigracilibium pacificum]NMM47842.1 hypothetical protein [Marinigracilibium pacificum]
MIIKWIFIISIIQFISYLVFDRLKVKHATRYIFTLVILGYLFILPPLFYPEPQPDGGTCGMPVLGITLGFWVIGGIAAPITHIIFRSIRPKERKKSLPIDHL